MGHGRALPKKRRIPISDERYPNFDGPCHLCAGTLVRRKVEFAIVRDYDEVYAQVILDGLPVLICSQCDSEWVLEDVVAGFDKRVQAEFDDILFAVSRS